MNTQKYDFNRQKTPDLGTTEQDNHRIAMIKDVVSEYRQAARDQLLRENRDLYGRVHQNRVQTLSGSRVLSPICNKPLNILEITPPHPRQPLIF